jgi:sugar lactone lactonase YvrE
MKNLCQSVVLALAAWTAGPLLAAPAPESLPAERRVGELEQVFAFTDAMPTGVSVARDGRIFVNFPRWGDDVPFTVAEIRDGKLLPYPSAAANQPNASDPADGFISVQSVIADARNRLWVLDTAAPSFASPRPGGAKLVAIDLKRNKIQKTYVLPADVLRERTYLNDVRFDFTIGKQGVAYITDSGENALIVLDLNTGKALRRLANHRSTSPDADKTQPFAVGADGIALSPDGATLYYCPLSSRRLFSVPTAKLRDPATSENDVAAAVRDLGIKGASDGLDADATAIYAGDYEHNAIRKLNPDGSWQTIAHDPRLLWPDTLSVGKDGYLYFIANQLHRQAGFQGGRDEREKPYGLFRVKL